MRCPQKLHPARLPLASWVGRPVKPNPDPILRPQAHRSLSSLGKLLQNALVENSCNVFVVAGYRTLCAACFAIVFDTHFPGEYMLSGASLAHDLYIQFRVSIPGKVSSKDLEKLV